MIVTETVGKIDLAIGRHEAPLLAYMDKENADFAKTSLKKKLFNVVKSKHYAESVGGLSGIGDFKKTQGAVPYETFEELATKTFIHSVFKKGIQIERELIDDSRLIDMKNRSGSLIEAANRTQEKFVHAPFVYAANTSFSLADGTFTATGSDGLSLVNAAHTSHTGKTANQSNKVTTAFGVDSLKDAEEAMVGFKTDIGEKSNAVPSMLLVPYELRNEAYEICASMGKLNSADNNANPYEAKYDIVVSSWLDSMGVTDKAYLIDESYMKKCLFWLDRVPLEVASRKDFNTDVWQIKGYMRYSLGFTDWRWVVGINFS